MSQKKEFLLSDNVKVEFNLAKFISTVTGATGDDHIGIALGSACNTYFPALHELDDEVLYGANILKTNCWFCGSALDGNRRRKANCLFTKSIIIETDYGKAGHKRESPFPDYRSAFDHICSQRIQPNMLWHSGHGFYLGFILDEIIHFSDAGKTALYEKHKMGLNKIFRGDSTCSPEHLFRTPCSKNTKPGCDSVKGTLLRWEVTP